MNRDPTKWKIANEQRSESAGLAVIANDLLMSQFHFFSVFDGSITKSFCLQIELLKGSGVFLLWPKSSFHSPRNRFFFSRLESEIFEGESVYD